MSNNEQTVAGIILEQLGGNKFVAMTGAKNLTRDGNSLRFHLPRGFAKNGINLVQITLDPSDTYTMVLSKYRGLKVTPIATVPGLYADNLARNFTYHTGLEVTL